MAGAVMTDVIFGGPGSPITAVGQATGVHVEARAFVWTAQCPPSPQSACGSSWQLVEADTPKFQGAGMNAISTAPAGFVAVGRTSTGNRIWRSMDGVRWDVAGDVREADEAAMYTVSRGNTHAAVVAVGSTPHGAAHRGAIWTSTDGSSWSRVPDAAMFAQASIESVAVFRERLVAVGFVSLPAIGVSPRAAAWISDDGRSWSPVTTIEGAAGSQMSAVAADRDRLVAVGSSSDPRGQAAWTSTDGTTWKRVPHSPAFAPGLAPGGMSDVERFDGGFVAVGSTGEMMGAMIWTSTDGTTWTRATLATELRSGSIAAVAAGGTRIVAVGVTGEGRPVAAWLSPPP